MNDPGRLEALEKEILKGELSRAIPIGLRYDRLAREGLLPPSDFPTSANSRARLRARTYWTRRIPEPTPPHLVCPASSYWACAERRESAPYADYPACAYWTCNSLFVSTLIRSSLVRGSRRLLLAAEESWVGGTIPDAVREVKIFTSAVFGRSGIPFSTGEFDLPYSDRAFDAVIADSSVLLSANLDEWFAESRRILRSGHRMVVLFANWEYEMEGQEVTYRASLGRYGGELYLAVTKRTLSPPQEIEYICLLDSRAPSVAKAARLSRAELVRLTVDEFPDIESHIVSVERIEIPQATSEALKEAALGAGFPHVTLSGAPGVLALRACTALNVLAGSGAEPEPPARETEGACPVCRALAFSFPFVPDSDSPHIIAVCDG